VQRAAGNLYRDVMAEDLSVTGLGLIRIVKAGEAFEGSGPHSTPASV
jgi:hypothetical protein